jgi:branched-chain amino acid aminotransferase
VGPYFKGGLKPIKLLIMEDYDRAAVHGLGDAKTGGNYAAGLRGMLAARERGFAEALYLDPAEHKYIEETGASNFFAITKDGTYVTPESGSILPSITNKSLMQVAKDLGMKVERRKIHVEELFDMAEVGAVGTAAIITPIHAIGYRDKLIEFTDEESVGPVSKQLYETLTAIQCGDIEDTHGWTHEVSLD